MENKKSPQTADLKSALSQLEATLDEYLVKKAPFTLPASVKQIIVSFAPWLILIGLVLAIPGILIALGLSAVVMPFAILGGAKTVGFSLGIILTIIMLVLEAMALPGLFKRAKSGWTFMYYSTLVGVVQNIVSLSLVGLIIGSLLSFYILFQVKEYYK